MGIGCRLRGRHADSECFSGLHYDGAFVASPRIVIGMQIDGVQINPREWWDEHWIHDRILSKLEPGKSSAAVLS